VAALRDHGNAERAALAPLRRDIGDTTRTRTAVVMQQKTIGGPLICAVRCVSASLHFLIRSLTSTEHIKSLRHADEAHVPIVWYVQFIDGHTVIGISERSREKLRKEIDRRYDQQAFS
jgi:hypothetical protein